MIESLIVTNVYDKTEITKWTHKNNIHKRAYILLYCTYCSKIYHAAIYYDLETGMCTKIRPVQRQWTVFLTTSSEASFLASLLCPSPHSPLLSRPGSSLIYSDHSHFQPATWTSHSNPFFFLLNSSFNVSVGVQHAACWPHLLYFGFSLTYLGFFCQAETQMTTKGLALGRSGCQNGSNRQHHSRANKLSLNCYRWLWSVSLNWPCNNSSHTY